MIRRVVIRRFKRFEEVVFDLPGHVVLAGPNNTGKTTMLQAVAAWALALERWQRLNDFQRHGGAYSKAPITRQTFSAVPLRVFDLLWNQRRSRLPLEIEVTDMQNRTVTMEFIHDTTEQVLVRPKPAAEPQTVRDVRPQVVFVPPMTGLSTDEPVYQRPKLEQLLGQGKPGDVIRNLLVEAHQSPAWNELVDCISRLFSYNLLPPNADGPDIIAEYQMIENGPRLDIASAGSGFQQVLMLLTFLHTRRGSVLLLDEPDAHLHVILQDAIYNELRQVAAKSNSQLIVATHSEVIINSVDPRELCVLLDQPRLLETTAQRDVLVESLRVLDNVDIMLALKAPGVLYIEGYTDLELLREWARILSHPAHELLTTRLFWKPTSRTTRLGGDGIASRDHYGALQLVRPDLPALELVDGDANPGIQSTPITGQGYQRLRWRRYEVESYLVHPKVLERFVVHQLGGDAFSGEAVAVLKQHFEDNYPPAVLRDPLGDHEFLNTTKARTRLIPPALDAAGLQGFSYTRYAEIAAMMQPEEIHPEVREKLDDIQRAFNL
jgi:AAA domain, putative AbiEii toxin, Type IV TA system